MHHVRRGSGKPLLLIHGLGSSWRSWSPVLDTLAAEREVIAVDLPGFGDSPPLPGEVSIAALTDAVEAFASEQNLQGVDVVGSSMGARMVLEMARRGWTGAVVALDPGGFWSDGQRRVFGASLAASIRLVRLIQPIAPRLTASPAGRTALFAQLSARPWKLPPDLVLTELRSLAASPSFDSALRALVQGPKQEGMPAGSAKAPITIGWGRKDRVTLPSQARTAQNRFPDARLHWFEDSGHFPQWDAPDQAARLILEGTGR